MIFEAELAEETPTGYLKYNGNIIEINFFMLKIITY